MAKTDEIIEAASKLFSQKGYRATNISEIGNSVGLHKTTLFHYVKSKEDILMSVIQIPLDEYICCLDKTVEYKGLSPEEKLRLALEKQISVICKYKDYLNVSMSDMRSLSEKNLKQLSIKRNRYHKKLVDLILEIQSDNKSNLFKGLDAKIVSFGIFGMCNWITQWYSENGSLTPKDISEIYYNMITGNKNRI